MFWQEDTNEEHFTLSERIQEASFKIQSKILPMDHSFLLAQALLKHLPWLADINAGIHDIGVADGNGWEQSKTGGFYHPSRRSKLTLRITKERLKDVQSLVGKTLDLGDYEIKVVKFINNKLLSDLPVLFAKQVACEQSLSEDDFLKVCYQQLSEMGIQVKKMMAGLEHNIQTDNGTIHTRSLMVADLKKDESVLLQEKGLGDHRLLGCGLFIPQKGIETIDS
ncbi:type I-MYXAN CRISPR-associated protein Cas6/Cmx6 [Candidatus Thioglobus autotrophicus]|uniref:type I-MYXAN CRISPR-associated protein Cas6/Cmx6 n=1 Tax=Candidatus Thioglobus autotrophicus TaxID=1705394 RepID=UPI00299EA27A|nr:type I-MYXAN CRISPR-associated protein Cas6/Cmx6 [Candidatus Thioglobus autotrophicus]WPE17097.1 type I-MYXAN CRISPR-associated protein Cas6/Cmx6 [Candidatus Thioglobus autotrophicus]